MNNATRKKTLKLVRQLEGFDLAGIQGQLMDLQTEEEEKVDNLPENLQGSEAGERMQNSSEALLEAVDLFDEVEGLFNDIYEALERATE